MLRYFCKTQVNLSRHYNLRNITKILNLELEHNIKCPAYVHIPEVPLLTEADSIERLEDRRADEIYKYASKTLLDFDTKCDLLINEETSPKDTYVNVIKPIQQGLVQPIQCVRAAQIAAAQTDDPALTIIANNLQKKLLYETDERFKNKKLYQTTCSADKEAFLQSEFDQGVVKYFAKQFTKTDPSVILHDKLHSQTVNDNKLLQAEIGTFKKNVWVTTRKFRLTIYDKDVGDKLPESLRKLIAVSSNRVDTGPWVMHLDSNTYPVFMQFCPNADLRESTWNGMNRRAGQDFVDEKYSNGVLVDRIRNHRRKIAKSMGYSNHGERVLEHSMAGSIDTVLQMIDASRTNFSDMADKEAIDLLNFAKENGFAGSRLEQWDIAYWSRMWNSEKSRELAPLDNAFPADHVLQELFNLTGELFGVEVVAKTDCTDEFTFLENGVEVGSFRLDSGLRPGKLKHLPKSVLSMPLAPATESTPASSVFLMNCGPYLTMVEFVQLVEAWGDLLQQTLTKVKDLPEISGQEGIPFDAISICATTMRNLVLRQPVILGKFAQGLTSEEVLTLSRFRSNTGSIFLMNSLFRSAFDLDMWLNDKHWRDVLAELYGEFMPFNLALFKKGGARDEWPASDLAIFAMGEDGKQYRDVWTRTIAADITDAFVDTNMAENGVSAAAQVGRRFRDTFLALGGAVPPAEVFRRFRGRDPVKHADIRY